MHIPASTKAWRKAGEQHPYYGVVKRDEFRGKSIGADTLNQFLATGEEHVRQIMAQVDRIAPDLSRSNALDFGCGTGRLVIPFAKRFQQVFGVDISEGMLSEAAKNVERQSVSNVELFRGLDSVPTELRFDLVHSYIVLQHVEVPLGMELIARLCERVEQRGVIAVHVTYAWEVSALRKLLNRARRRIPGLHYIANIAKNKSWDEPLKTLNEYEIGSVLEVLSCYSFTDVTCIATNHAGHKGFMMISRRPKSEEGVA